MVFSSYFNSRPSARGDYARYKRIQQRQDFNSRPSARGDGAAGAGKEMILISIHAPPRGATFAGAVGMSAEWYFNSRPSARGDKRRVAKGSRRAFQFTPLREGRRAVCASLHDAQISIHAPPRGATLPFAPWWTLTPFQFTPLREGRLTVSVYDSPRGAISIHAPPRGATGLAKYISESI